MNYSTIYYRFEYDNKNYYHYFSQLITKTKKNLIFPQSSNRNYHKKDRRNIKATMFIHGKINNQ